MFRTTGLVPCVVAFAEMVGERSAAPGDAGSHRSRRDAEHLADLGVIEAYEIPQRDRGAVIRRELRHGGIDVELVGDEVVDRLTAAARFGDDVDRVTAAGPGAGLRRARRWWRPGSTTS